MYAARNSSMRCGRSEASVDPPSGPEGGVSAAGFGVSEGVAGSRNPAEAEPTVPVEDDLVLPASLVSRAENNGPWSLEASS